MAGGDQPDSQAGAADAWLVPIVMKKGRPAHTLAVLAHPHQAGPLRDIIFAETSTIGIRETTVTEICAAPGLGGRRHHRRHHVPIKIAHRDGRSSRQLPSSTTSPHSLTVRAGPHASSCRRRALAATEAGPRTRRSRAPDTRSRAARPAPDRGERTPTDDGHPRRDRCQRQQPLSADPDQILDDQRRPRVHRASLAAEDLDGRSVCVIVPDGTRSCPLPLLISAIHQALVGRASQHHRPDRARHPRRDERSAPRQAPRLPGRRAGRSLPRPHRAQPRMVETGGPDLAGFHRRAAGQ